MIRPKSRRLALTRIGTMHDVETESRSEPAPAAPATNKAALFIVFLVVVIDLLGFGIVLPLLPRYGRVFIPDGKANPMYGVILGLLMASFSMMQFIFMPIWGRVSDQIGRKPILLMGLASSVVFYALFGYASGLTGADERMVGLVLLFVARIGAGIAGATIGTAQAAIADCTTQQGRSRGMALIGAAFGLGFFFGPILGYLALLIFKADPHTPSVGPGYLAAALSFAALIFGIFKLPETLRPGEPSHARRNWLNLRGWKSAVRVPGVTLAILIFFLATFAFAIFESTLSLLNDEIGLGLSDENNFFVFAYIGFVLAVVQGVFYRRLAKRVPEISFMKVGALLMVLGLGGIGGVANFASDATGSSLGLLVGLLFILIVAITGFAFMVPSVQALVSRLSDPSRQGEVLGINQSMNAVARILGPAVGMPLYALGMRHALPYAFGATLLFIVLLLTLRLGASDALTHLRKEDPPHAA
jgi:MFS family permease